MNLNYIQQNTDDSNHFMTSEGLTPSSSTMYKDENNALSDREHVDHHQHEHEHQHQHQHQRPPFLLARSPILAARSTSNVSGSKRKKRQTWSKEEDILLLELVKNVSTADNKPIWSQIAEKVNKLYRDDNVGGGDDGNDNNGNTGFFRTGKQCRERWQNHLRPNIKKGNWTIEEEEQIRTMFHTFGPKWSCMAKLMKERTDNDIKNKWNSMLRTQRAQAIRFGHARAVQQLRQRYSSRQPPPPQRQQQKQKEVEDVEEDDDDEAQPQLKQDIFQPKTNVVDENAYHHNHLGWQMMGSQRAAYSRLDYSDHLRRTTSIGTAADTIARATGSATLSTVPTLEDIGWNPSYEYGNHRPQRLLLSPSWKDSSCANDSGRARDA